MAQWRPDPTFYPSPQDGHAGPGGKTGLRGYAQPDAQRQPDALAVVDVDPDSSTYSRIVGQVEMPNVGDELHHFGWNACGSCLCPYSPHPHMERRYLIVPGIALVAHLHRRHQTRSPSATHRQGHRTRDSGATGRLSYSPHGALRPRRHLREHPGLSRWRGPGGIFMMDPESFESEGAVGDGPRAAVAGYDFWWHLGPRHHDHQRMGHAQHGEGRGQSRTAAGRQIRPPAARLGSATAAPSASTRPGFRAPDGAELRPAHDPTKAYGFVGVGVSLKDLSSSIWLWHTATTAKPQRAAQKVIEIPPSRPTRPTCRRCSRLQGRAAAGHRHQSVPRRPLPLRLVLGHRRVPPIRCLRSLQTQDHRIGALGGIVRRAAHPQPAQARPQRRPANGRNQPDDGRRIYFTNSLYAPWDAQFYPEGIKGWMVKLDAEPEGGHAHGSEILPGVPGDLRGHQIRLKGGDASSDSYCYP